MRGDGCEARWVRLICTDILAGQRQLSLLWLLV